jgi:hypothetical protein
MASGASGVCAPGRGVPGAESKFTNRADYLLPKRRLKKFLTLVPNESAPCFKF